MKQNSLSVKGLSMSQAQSVSNLCNQEATEIARKLHNLNNCSKKLIINEVEYITQDAAKMPTDIVELLTRKGALHACQAFLMENIKAKESLMDENERAMFHWDVAEPNRFQRELPHLKPNVDEDWGFDQLSTEEVNEYYEVESLAAHYGQFIHKEGILDKLRKQLTNRATLEWEIIEHGKKTPVKLTYHNTPEELLRTHNEIAELHRKAEMRVNYFKAKVKNLVSQENADIAEYNGIEKSRVKAINEKTSAEFTQEQTNWIAQREIQESEFETKRNIKMKELASLRINIPERFKPIVDEFM